jgi:hypothetical protein
MLRYGNAISILEASVAFDNDAGIAVRYSYGALDGYSPISWLVDSKSTA